MSIAMSNEGYDISLLKFRCYAARNPGKLKRVIVPLSYHSFWGVKGRAQNFGEALSNQEWESEKYNRYAYIKYLNSSGKSGWNWNLLFEGWTLPSKKSLAAFTRYLIGSNGWKGEIAYVGGYQRSYSSQLTQKMLEESLATYANTNKYEFNRGSMDCIQDFLIEGAKDNIVVTLVFFPIHPEYKSKIPDFYKQELKTQLGIVTKAYGGAILDLSDFKLDLKCYQDHTHLNALGSDVFTPRLNSALKDQTI